MKKTIITCFVCCLLGLVKGWAHPYKVSEIPMVHLQDRTRYVSNPDQILSASTVSSIDNILYALEQRTGIETLPRRCRNAVPQDIWRIPGTVRRGSCPRRRLA